MILNKPVLVDNIKNDISDNSIGAISPYDIRHNFLDLIDSVHLLTSGENIISKNFASISTRTTKAGYKTLEKLGLQNYTSVDNSAFGFESLKSNYQGARNTALGSRAISCNIYGSDNLAAGFSSLAGNTTGFGNVGVGNYTLSKNKIGHWNIAIGHAAGYYAKDVSNKLFIASHPVDDQHVCDNPLGSGWTPLVYGDLSQDTLRFGVAVSSLHDYGTLQVSGNITPSESSIYDLGHPSYAFRNLHLVDSVRLGSKSLSYVSSGNQVSLDSNLIPSNHNWYNLGNSQQRWLKGYFDQVITNTMIATQKAHYLHHTIYLASSGYIDTLDGGGPFGLYDHSPSPEETGHPSGYLPDEELFGAGLILRSSDKQFEFLFHPHNSGNFPINCYDSENQFSKSHWTSNVSLHIDSGCHLLSDRIIGYNDTLSLTTNYACFGLYLDSGRKVVLGDEYWVDNKNKIAGFGDLNVITSGDSDYTLSILSPESGVSITQQFLSATKYKSTDSLNGNKDKLEGFNFKYITGEENVFGPLPDRFCINSFNKTSRAINSFVLLKDSEDGGCCSINDLNTDSDSFFPNTTLNVRSHLNGTIRVSSENAGFSRTSLQLVGENNCLENGFEIQYLHPSGFVDFNIVKDSGSTTAIRISDNNTIDVLATSGGLHDDMITIGDALHDDVFVSIYEGSGTPVAASGYGKIFVNKKEVYPSQSSAIKYMDSSGNVFDISLNKYDSTSNLLFTDENQNTLAGFESSKDRHNLISSFGNTSIGYKSLHNIDVASGSYNVAVGVNALSGIVNGSYNVGLGINNLTNLSNTDISHNIVISSSGISNVDSDYNFLLGVNDNLVLLSGVLGPSNNDKHLYMPVGGRFSTQNTNNDNALSIYANNIEVVNTTGSEYADNQLTFSFTADATNDLFVLDHSNPPLSTTPLYTGSSGPFAELKGDLRLLGSLNFSDGTSINSYSDVVGLLSSVTQIFGSISGINHLLDTLIVEGTSLQRIGPAADINTPSSGIINVRNGSNIVVVNRDKYTDIREDEYIIAIKIGQEYRPIWIGGNALLPCCDS